MKRYLVLILFVVLLCPASWAAEMTFQEVKTFLEDTRMYHEPPDMELEKWVEDTQKEDPMYLPENIQPDYDGYDYPTVEISKLWEKLGIKEQGKFTIFEKEERQANSVLLLHYPEVEVFERADLKILRVKEGRTQDYQFFFFKKKGEDFVYVDHFEAEWQKYDNPRVKFYDDKLFSIRISTMHGTGLLAYDDIFFTIENNKLRKLLRIEGEYHHHGGPSFYGTDIVSDIKVNDDMLVLGYSASFKISGYYCYYYEAECAEKSLFTAKRKIVYDWDGKTLALNDAESELSPEDAKAFVKGEGVAPSIFEKEFEKAGQKPEFEQWYADLRSKEEEGE